MIVYISQLVNFFEFKVQIKKLISIVGIYSHDMLFSILYKTCKIPHITISKKGFDDA